MCLPPHFTVPTSSYEEWHEAIAIQDWALSPTLAPVTMPCLYPVCSSLYATSGSHQTSFLSPCSCCLLLLGIFSFPSSIQALTFVSCSERPCVLNLKWYSYCLLFPSHDLPWAMLWGRRPAPDSHPCLLIMWLCFRAGLCSGCSEVASSSHWDHLTGKQEPLVPKSEHQKMQICSPY